jgi:hypothetical protein
MIFTTNKPLSEWGKVLHDEDLAAAILDRVLERGRFVHLDGPSGRTRHLNLEEASPAKGRTAQNFRNPHLRLLPVRSVTLTNGCGVCQPARVGPSVGPVI